MENSKQQQQQQKTSQKKILHRFWTLNASKALDKHVMAALVYFLWNDIKLYPGISVLSYSTVYKPIKQLYLS